MLNLTKAQEHFTAIAKAQADYAKSSFEAGKAYYEKLSGVKSPANFVEVTTDYAKSAHEHFVAEANKIGELYKAFGKDVFAANSTK